MVDIKTVKMPDRGNSEIEQEAGAMPVVRRNKTAKLSQLLSPRSDLVTRLFTHYLLVYVYCVHDFNKG